MSWQKYFTVVPQNQLLNNKLLQYNKDNLNDSSVSALGNKYSSFLPEIYSGNPNRIQRYVQYDQMDMDSEISSALDTLADFCSQVEEQSGVPFELDYSDKINETEVQILQTSLKQWVKINQFNRRLWRTFRNVLKYGDQFFIRDPETSELHWVDHNKVDGVKVAENEGKKPSVYLIRDLDLNLQSMTATSTQSLGQTYTGMPVLGTPMKYTAQGMPSSGLLTPAANPLTSRNGASGSMQQYEVDARHVVHLSLSEGMDINWPFGTSILESIFKTYKQKELLEDSIIIYRIQRAPERRIFYIDVGNMPPHKAMAHIERVKNEIHQRRIPSRTGGGSCLDLSTRIPMLNGRTLSLYEIITEFENKKELWAYSCNPETGQIVPGLITWAGVTRKNTEVIKLTLDNGKTIICTPDHKFPILGKGKTEAKDITPNKDVLIGFNVQYSFDFENNINSEYNSTKQEVFDNFTKTWIPTDKLVKTYFENINQKEYTKIQEKDSNKYEYSKSDNLDSDNRTVISIEKIENMDTGTITIDGNEKYHNFHTFAIDQGIFIYNSVVDAAYNPLSILEDYFFANSADGRGSKVETLPGGECLALDTKIKLLDGRDLELNEIIKEFESGKQLWTYSCNPENGEIVPGKIDWAGVTRKNTQVVKLTFDNGESVVCTPDHKFPILGKGFVEAQNLEIGESMIPHYEREKTITPMSQSTYTQIFNNKSKEWEYVHRMVANYFKGTPLEQTMIHDQDKSHLDKKTIHHIDFNRYNNSPENLTWMNNQDHHEYHYSNIKKYYEYLRQHPEEYRKYKDKNIKSQKEFYSNMSIEDKEKLRIMNREKFILGNIVFNKMMNTDSNFREMVLTKKSIKMKQHFINEPERKEKIRQNNYKMWSADSYDSHYNKVFENQTIKFDEYLLKLIYEKINADCNEYQKLIDILNTDDNFISYYRKLNSDLNAPNRSVDNLIFTYRHLILLLNQFGYKSWKEYYRYVKKEKNWIEKKVKSLNSDQYLIKKIVEYYNSGIVKQAHILDKCNSDVEFLNHLNSINSGENKHYKSKQIENISINHFLSILAHHGYRNFNDFKDKTKYFNHKLVSIEWLDEPQDTGCITVDLHGEYHNFHTFVLSACNIYTKNSLGEIDDLKYFNHKLTRGLGIPIAYMPSGPEDANVAFTDGRVGTAYIQEFRFGKRCQRLQNLISWVFDNEFKLFVKLRGIDIESNLYELKFNKPENFSKYRQIELDSAQLNLINNLFDIPFLSKRFVMERYMNLNQEEMLRNERMWKEENPKKVKNLINTEDSTNLGLGAIGVKSGFSDITLPNEPSPDSSGLEPATGSGGTELSTSSDTGVESIET